jgi:hypothetical protein
MAVILEDTALTRQFQTERDDFSACLNTSLRMAIQNTRIDFIPGCVELGDRDPTSTTIGISPCGELGNIPEPQLSNTFNWFYQHIQDRRANKFEWQAYLPYEIRAAGTYLYLGQKDRTLDLLEYYLSDRRPLNWNQWPEINLHDREAPKFIGDMPHSWVGSDYIRTIRSLFVYERESDEALVVGAGLAEAWVTDPVGVTVKRLPTYYGVIDYTVRTIGNRVTFDLSGTLEVPKGKIVVRSPLQAAVRGIEGPGSLSTDHREAVVAKLPARITFVY